MPLIHLRLPPHAARILAHLIDAARCGALSFKLGKNAGMTLDLIHDQITKAFDAPADDPQPLNPITLEELANCGKWANPIRFEIVFGREPRLTDDGLCDRCMNAPGDCVCLQNHDAMMRKVNATVIADDFRVEHSMQAEHDREAYGCEARVAELESLSIVACENPQCQWSRMPLSDVPENYHDEVCEIDLGTPGCQCAERYSRGEEL